MALRMHWRAVLPALAALAAAGVNVPASAQPADLATPARDRPCPAGLDDVAQCSIRRDANGAWVLTAMPRNWNQMLVVHAHGGPRLGTPDAGDSDEDLERFAVMVRSGFAWTGSTYRRGGYGVRMAAEDVDASRAAFWAAYGRPRRTILHGQSYGGNVAAKLAELRAVDGAGQNLYDGVLLTNGVLWGGTRAYGFRADLRAIYQYVCGNHPRPDEPQYPLWQGLPADSRMTRADLEARLNECTGLDRRESARSTEQRERLATLSAVSGIAPGNILRHLEWATFTFRDMISRIGGNPFDNSMTRYTGSSDDEALNRDIARWQADPAALSALRYDSDLTGQIAVPTLAMHWRDDPVVSAAGDAAYEQQILAQANGNLFLRLTTGRGTHSRLSDAEYLAALSALVAWVDGGRKPAAANIADACRTLAGTIGSNCSME